MNIFNIIAGSASIISLFITIFVSFRTKKIKAETEQIYKATLQIKNEINIIQNNNSKNIESVSQDNSSGDNNVSL